ncbi:MAG TPA: hypothetical protein VGA04_12875 [Streptosporangiaceae bacterium]
MPATGLGHDLPVLQDETKRDREMRRSGPPGRGPGSGRGAVTFGTLAQPPHQRPAGLRAGWMTGAGAAKGKPP